MPRITPVHWRILECVLKKDGFVFGRQQGDHRIYSKKGIDRPIVIPTYKEIDIAIIQSNMRTAGMDRRRYFQLFKECKKAS